MLLTLDVFGDVQLRRRLLRWAEGAEDMSPAFESVSDDFLEIERRQFDSEGSFASVGWAALSEPYRSIKSILYPGKGILEATGALRGSLAERGPGHVREIRSDEMFVGTEVPHAAHHQSGTSKMPQRRPVELRETDRRRWMQILQRHLAGAEAGGGLTGLMSL